MHSIPFIPKCKFNVILFWNHDEANSISERKIPSLNRPSGFIKKPWYDTISNKYTGPGNLYLELKTESNIYTIGEEEVPNLVTPKTEILAVGPYISYT